MTLSQLLSDQLNSTVANDNGPWRQFVLDHLDYLARRTVPRTIDALEMNQYRYDLARFVKEKMQRSQDMTWIVLLLNNLSCHLDFKEPGDYVIPEDRLILDLYSLYVTTTANKM